MSRIIIPLASCNASIPTAGSTLIKALNTIEQVKDIKWTPNYISFLCKASPGDILMIVEATTQLKFKSIKIN